MATLTTQDVLRLARLAKLQLTDNELHTFANELSAILGYVEQLGSVNITGLEPTSQVTGLVNVTRPDEIIDYSESQAELLQNAVTTEDGLIKVKRILE